MKIGSVLYKMGDNLFPNDNLFICYEATDVRIFDLIILHGGEDISPSLYNQKAVHTTASNFPSERDKTEVSIIKEAVKLGIPIFGICRGAQLLCAMSGGSLFQHVDGHESNGLLHDIITPDGQILPANSYHHQAMRLDPKGILLAQTSKRLSEHRWCEDYYSEPESGEPEVEAAWWPELNAVGVQGHPEWMSPKTPFVKFCKDLIKDYLRV